MSDENEDKLTPEAPDIAGKGKEAVNKTAEKGFEAFKKKLKEQVFKKGATAAAKSSIAAALGPIISWVVLVIVALIILIGIIMFFITMPGMVMEKIKALAKEIGNKVASWFGEGTEEQIDDQEIYNVLDYLEEMGYDLKGYGFLTKYIDGEDDGVSRNDEGKIDEACSDFIYSYLISENYIYTIRNFNVNTKGMFSGIVAAFDHFLALFLDDLTNRTGMLTFYHEGANGIGDSSENLYDAIELGSIKVDANAKQLLIKKNSFLNGNNAMQYSLDGWTGRYGMPIDFLLSIHLATMMPDLAYDMTQNFSTNIKILLHKSSGKVDGLFKTKNGAYVTYEEISNAINGVAGRNPLSALWSRIDELALNPSEAEKMIELGIVPPKHGVSCSCETSDAYKFTDESGMTHYVYKAGDDSYYYIDYTDDMYGGTTVIVEDVSTLETVSTLTKLDDECKAYLKAVVKYTHAGNDYNYETYVPYIENVTDHWYRDVYFIADTSTGNNFVNYDYDYESLTKERWTLYETDENGDYCYYKVDENGQTTSERYYPTSAELDNLNDPDKRAEVAVPFSKKAETIKISDEYEDLSWNDLSDKGLSGVYSAYDTESSETTDYQNPYKGDDAGKNDIYKNASDTEKSALDNIYVAVNIGTVTQTGEGQRTETNSKIKKMFLNNRYFRYDGKSETAEVITALRNKLNLNYGPITLSDTELKKEYDLSEYGIKNDTKYSVEDLSGNVSINQDSLNAFSMLENEHTLDADYIYRDFKELIVELGYFEKEELTDEIPRLLQWVIPDVGSGGFPFRAIDKNEHVFGTMAHSEKDMAAYTATQLKMIAKLNEGDTENPQGAGKEKEILEPGKGIEDDDEKISSKAFNDKQNNLVATVASLNNTPIKLLETIGSVIEISPAKYTYTPSGSNDTGSKTGDLEFDGVAYEVWKQTKLTCTLYSFAFIAQAYTGESCQKYVVTSSGDFINKNGEGSGTNEYWNDGVLWSCFEAVGITGKFIMPGDAQVAEQVGQALGEGKPVYFYGDLKASAGYHAVVLLGADNNGKVIFYDPGSGIVDTYGDSSNFSANLTSLISTHFKHRIFIPDELPIGVNKTKAAESYTGYQGNEAVVSPVTGILLEYSTYTDADINSVNKENERTNTDLKYGNIYSDKEDDTKDKDPNASSEKIPYDQVGYAKILLLDDENYEKFEKDIKEKTTQFTDKSFLSKTGNYLEYKQVAGADSDLNDDIVKDWNNYDKTLYGYKEFAESYKEAGISGCIVYIDGFVPELPDEKLTGGEEGAGGEGTEGEEIEMSDQLPEGEKIENINYFEKINKDNLEDEEQLDTLYEKDDDLKMASQKATDKLKNENSMKDAAATTYTIGSGDSAIRIIKEGTVIGRTMTDKELFTKYRKGEDASITYEYYRPEHSDEVPDDGAETPTDQIMGNYLRVIFKDTDDTNIENVEDYMKLDDVSDSKGGIETDFPEKFLFWLGVLEEGACEGKYDLGDSYGFEVLNDGAGNTTAFGLTKAISGVGKVPEMYPDFASHLGSGSVPKQEAQDVFVLVLEAARESLIGEDGNGGQIKDPSKMSESELDALVELNHASPRECQNVCDIYNSVGKVTVTDFENHWGSNENYGAQLRSRGHCRGVLAVEGKYLLYNANQAEVQFKTETPWTDFCGGTPSRELYSTN